MNASGVATIPLPATGDVTLGRGEDCDVRIDDKKLSRRHAVVRTAGDRVELIDLGSMNGTVVGDRRLAAHTPTALAPGVMATLGSSAILVQATQAAAGAGRTHVL